MATEVRQGSLYTQARVARDVSAELRDDSRALIAVSEELRQKGRACFERRRRAASKRLELKTATVDDGVAGWAEMRRFVEFDSNMVGRSIVIEDAKTLLCERYDISRGEAFAILRRASSRSNRKLRDVAERLVGESIDR